MHLSAASKNLGQFQKSLWHEKLHPCKFFILISKISRGSCRGAVAQPSKASFKGLSHGATLLDSSDVGSIPGGAAVQDLGKICREK